MGKAFGNKVILTLLNFWIKTKKKNDVQTGEGYANGEQINLQTFPSLNKYFSYQSKSDRFIKWIPSKPTFL